MTMKTLDEIVQLLDAHKQRATYQAVADYLGLPPRSLMKGREKTPANSWIVNTGTGLPTDYQPHELHPDLAKSRAAFAIRSRDALTRWLSNPK